MPKPLFFYLCYIVPKTIYVALCKKCKWSLALAVLALLIYSCSNSPAPTLQNTSIPNPEAPLAFFGKGNLSEKERLKYAEAMQKTGIFNFVTDDFSEEQIEHSVEIRISYSEEGGKLNKIPTLGLQAEFLEYGQVKFKFTLVEKSDLSTINPRAKSREKAFRQEVLLQRFLEELKRVKSKNENSFCG